MASTTNLLTLESLAKIIAELPSEEPPICFVLEHDLYTKMQKAAASCPEPCDPAFRRYGLFGVELRESKYLVPGMWLECFRDKTIAHLPDGGSIELPGGRSGAA